MILTLCAAAAAWSAPACAQQMSLKHYGKSEGLSNLNVTCLLQGASGPLWMCTEDGLFRYDGDEFRRFGEADGLDNPLVFSAAIDRNGALWVQTTSDVYLGIDGRFKPVRPQGKPLRLAEGAPLISLRDGKVATVLDGRAIELRRDLSADGGWSIGALYTSGNAASGDVPGSGVSPATG